jgi:hypothetical protein
MPKWRKLHVKATESLDINEMPDDFHRLLWVMLPLGLDRRGRGLDTPSWIKSKVMTVREDVTPEMITAAMNWYAGHGMIERYNANGREYFWIPTWHGYQGDTSKEAESNFPPPSNYIDPKDTDGQEEVENKSGEGQEEVPTKAGSDSDAYVDSHADSDALKETPSAADTPAPKQKRKVSPKQQEAQEMFSALAGVCQINLTTLTETQRKQLNQSEKILRADGAIPIDMGAFATWWYANDWRGKKGDAPRPAQVRETWGQFKTWREGGQQHGTKYQSTDPRAPNYRPPLLSLNA